MAQYIDPMQIYAAKANTGAQVADMFNTIGQTVGGIFARLPEAQRTDAQRMDDMSYKQGLLTTARDALQKIGIDPNQVQFPSAEDRYLDKEKFTEQIGNILAPYAEGEGARLTPELFQSIGQSQNSAVQESVQKQKFLSQYDPMSRLDFNQMQTIEPTKQPERQMQGPALPEGSRSSYDPISGNGIDTSTETTNVAPESKKFDADTMLGMMTPLLIDSVKRGEMSPGKATEKILDLKLLDKKMESDQQKADNEYRRNLADQRTDTQTKQNFESGQLDKKLESDYKIAQLNANTRLQSGGLGANTYSLTPEEQEALSRALDNGLDPYVVNSRTARIYAQEEMLHPGRKWNELGGQAKFLRSQQTMNSIALINSITPLFNNVLDLGQKLNNTNVQFANTAINELRKQTGNPDIIAFNNARDDMVAEAERALLGSGALSDTKIKRAWDNVNSSMNYKQLVAAINNLQFTLDARKEALLSGPFPNANKKVDEAQSSSPKRKRFNPQTGAFEVVE